MDKTTHLLSPVYRVTLASMNSGTTTTTTTTSSGGASFFAGTLFNDHPMIAFLICFIVSLLILATLIGNAMVCLAIFMVRKLKSQPANLLLISLAMADLGVGFCVMPIALINVVEDKWILGDAICRFWTSADLTLCTASILNLCMISVDRYLVVTRPLRYSAIRTRRRILFYIAIVWIGALLVSTAPLIVLPWNRIEKTCQVSH
uniref:G-protein coupled receptors family 1 profile domain-containing protein n=1 Tax=Panagrolaimus superbus TaxID=310955 RepID=A0A914Y735_9BILA